MEPQLIELQPCEVRKLFKREVVKLLTISMMFLVSAITCITGKFFADLSFGVIFTSVVGILISGHWLILHFNDYKDYRDPISSDGCLLLDRYSQEHDEVKAYLKRVNQQGRPVMYPDLWRVNSWRSQMDTTRKALELQEACKRVNGRSAST